RRPRVVGACGAGGGSPAPAVGWASAAKRSGSVAGSTGSAARRRPGRDGVGSSVPASSASRDAAASCSAGEPGVGEAGSCSSGKAARRPRGRRGGGAPPCASSGEVPSGEAEDADGADDADDAGEAAGLSAAPAPPDLGEGAAGGRPCAADPGRSALVGD